MLSVLGDRALGVLGWAAEWHVVTRAPNMNLMMPGPLGPIHFRTNGDGIRDDDVPQKQPGERRIMVAGDSQTEGWNIPEDSRFSERMEQLLGLRVINAGQGGKEPRWYLHSFDWLAPRYRPDYYLVFVFANDLFESDPGGDDYAGTRDLLQRQMTEPFWPVERVARSIWPHFFVFLQRGTSYYPHESWGRPAAPGFSSTGVGTKTLAEIEAAARPVVSPDRIAAWHDHLSPATRVLIDRKALSDGITVGLAYPDYWRISFDVEGERAESSWRTMQSQLTRLFANARALRTRPILCYLPHPIQYDSRFIKPEYLETGVELRPEWYGTPSELQRRLAGLASDAGVPHLDLQAAMLAYPGDKSRLYFSGGDPHLMPEGNRVVGDAVASWLRVTHLAE